MIEKKGIEKGAIIIGSIIISRQRTKETSQQIEGKYQREINHHFENIQLLKNK